MKIIRPIRLEDLDALLMMAKTAGAGFTSLPPIPEFLRAKIELSLRSFDAQVAQAGHERYMFVLEDAQTHEIGGCCAVEAACGLDEPFYNYRLGLTVHASRALKIYNRHPTLYLSNDYTGTSVLCSLYLRPEFREGGMGHLLSKSRLLFMASHAQRFAERVIAEMRGVSNEQGHSPFWEGLGRHFFSIEYDEAEHIVGTGNKTLIAELMPQHPIYTNLLPSGARDVIGTVHPQTAPALKMLEQEGFRYQGYVDIFDGGPTVEAPLPEIRSIKRSLVMTLRHAGGEAKADGEGTRCLIANTQLHNYRCAIARLSWEDGGLAIPTALASALQVKPGDPLRVVAL
jgi:arginine N-succinyltransferase